VEGTPQKQGTETTKKGDIPGEGKQPFRGNNKKKTQRTQSPPREKRSRKNCGYLKERSQQGSRWSEEKLHAERAESVSVKKKPQTRKNGPSRWLEEGMRGRCKFPWGGTRGKSVKRRATATASRPPEKGQDKFFGRGAT